MKVICICKKKAKDHLLYTVENSKSTTVSLLPLMIYYRFSIV